MEDSGAVRGTTKKEVAALTTILVVEDEEPVCDLVRVYLEKEAFTVEVAHDGREALAKVEQGRYDLILLDIMLPEVDGWAICKEVRKTSSTPIIMLTAKSEEFDRILGLELGADDYISKPFSPREMVARVKAVLRRAQGADTMRREVLNYPQLMLDKAANRVEVAGQEVQLTPREFELLWFLASRPERVFTREQLLESVWGYQYLGDARTVDTHVRRLREKLRPAGISYIKTIWGKGYKFEVNQD
ncbi:MAG TPA: response regulator transcription factor [Firmicutes bacterium]|nr:response regulator transcription factor [Bacillota bacterium]